MDMDKARDWKQDLVSGSTRSNINGTSILNSSGYGSGTGYGTEYGAATGSGYTRSNFNGTRIRIRLRIWN